MKLLVLLIIVLLITSIPLSFAQTAIPDSCDDSDGGMKPKVKGTVSGYQNETSFGYTDSCRSILYLREYYCTDTGWTERNYNCQDYGPEYYCFDGRCKTVGGGVGCPPWRCVNTPLGIFTLEQLVPIVVIAAVLIVVMISAVMRSFAKR